jgi:hypothetical protein
MRRIVFLLIAIYVAGYGVFRQTQTEVWANDSNSYVIFPDSVIGRVAYYAWRPLAYLDGKLSGMRFHIGPHQV